MTSEASIHQKKGISKQNKLIIFGVSATLVLTGLLFVILWTAGCLTSTATKPNTPPVPPKTPSKYEDFQYGDLTLKYKKYGYDEAEKAFPLFFSYAENVPVTINEKDVQAIVYFQSKGNTTFVRDRVFVEYNGQMYETTHVYNRDEGKVIIHPIVGEPAPKEYESIDAIIEKEFQREKEQGGFVGESKKDFIQRKIAECTSDMEKEIENYRLNLKNYDASKPVYDQKDLYEKLRKNAYGIAECTEYLNVLQGKMDSLLAKVLLYWADN